MKNKFFLILSFVIPIFIILLFIIILERIILKDIIKKKSETLFPEEFYNFYEKESMFVNHLRDLSPEIYKEGRYKEPTNLMYDVIGNGSTSILVQGDSWAEQFSLTKFSKNKIDTFVKHKDVRFTLAGVTSYSPSPMTAQLSRLRNHYKLNFQHIIAFVDQTDIGDELCRYAELRVEGTNGLIVRPYDSTQSHEIYGMFDYFENLKILRSDNLNLTKAILYSKNKIVRLFRQKTSLKSGWSCISKPLLDGISIEQRKYLLRVFGEYINTVFEDQNVKSLIFVTFPHLNHLNGKYNLDVREIIVEAIKTSLHYFKIQEIRPELDVNSKKFEEGLVYRSNDPGSHLTDHAHAEYLVDPLLKKLNELVSIRDR